MMKWKVFTFLYSTVLYAYVCTQVDNIDWIFITLSILYFTMVINIYFIKEVFRIISSLFFFTSTISFIGAMFDEWYWGFISGIFLMTISLFILVANYSFTKKS
ncbi:hypothetical protein KHA96_10330 [Bacillus sp. FJAT-49711]|uniref:hypothetical protein n=1 Tax=Bacillus sp. FJAT-49711 TaxID=2833585 RepID=UPI001BCA2735|nr:hypothetical protein [Bacillus sp. FJAT-49711]MBS4218708.1 hypothetical protein [Bacillus sp. FJAT-49711]